MKREEHGGGEPEQLLRIKRGLFQFKIELEQRDIKNYSAKMIEYSQLRENKVFQGKLLCQFIQIEAVSHEQFLDTLNYTFTLRFKALFSYFDIPTIGQQVVFLMPPPSEQQEIQVVTNGSLYGIVNPIDLQQSIISSENVLTGEHGGKRPSVQREGAEAARGEGQQFCSLTVDDVRFEEGGVVVVFLKQGGTDAKVKLEDHFIFDN